MAQYITNTYTIPITGTPKDLITIASNQQNQTTLVYGITFAQVNPTGTGGSSNSGTYPRPVINLWAKTNGAATSSLILTSSLGGTQYAIYGSGSTLSIPVDPSYVLTFPKPISLTQATDILQANLSSSGDITGVTATISSYIINNFNPSVSVVGNWTSGTTYYLNNIVGYSANAYICINTSSTGFVSTVDPADDTSNWLIFSSITPTLISSGTGIVPFTTTSLANPSATISINPNQSNLTISSSNLVAPIISTVNTSNSLVNLGSINVPQVPLNITDTFTTNNLTQTITNKTLINPTINGYTENISTISIPASTYGVTNPFNLAPYLKTSTIIKAAINDTNTSGTITYFTFGNFGSASAYPGTSITLMLSSPAANGAGANAQYQFASWQTSSIRFPQSYYTGGISAVNLGQLNGNNPYIIQANNEVSIYGFVCDGTSWFGTEVGDQY